MKERGRGTMKGENTALRSQTGTRPASSTRSGGRSATSSPSSTPATRASSLTRSSMRRRSSLSPGGTRGSLSPMTREASRGSSTVRESLRRLKRKPVKQEPGTGIKDKEKNVSPSSTIQSTSSVASAPSEQSPEGSMSAQNTPKSTPSIRTRLSTGSIQMNGTNTISSAKEKAEMDTIIKQIVKSEVVTPVKTAVPVNVKKRTAPILTAPELATGDHPPPKKRKIGRNDGTGEDNNNDYFCWLCHKEGTLVCCELCPRVYHTRCLGLTGNLPQDWVCPECEKIMRAECIDTRSKAMEMLTLDQLCTLLRYALDRMKHAGSEPFQKAVDPSLVLNYSDYIFNPMDIQTLEKNIKKKQYGCTEALLADTKWILHNCIIYNGAHHKLTTSAKMIIKICKHEMNEIELCPDCYLNSCIRVNNEWFSEPCRVPHTLVWAKLKGYPFWPSKALRELDGQVDVRFFGAHDRSWVPVSQCFLLSKNIPTGLLKGKKNAGLDGAIDELNHHINKLREQFGGFEYAPFRTPYDKTDSYKPIIKPNTAKLQKSPSFFYSSQKPIPILLKRSAVSKTASALKNKYTAIVTMKKLDSTPEKIKQKSGHLTDLEMKDKKMVTIKKEIDKDENTFSKSDDCENSKCNETFTSTTHEDTVDKKPFTAGGSDSETFKENLKEITTENDKTVAQPSEIIQEKEKVKSNFSGNTIVERLAIKLAMADADNKSDKNETEAMEVTDIKVNTPSAGRKTRSSSSTSNSERMDAKNEANSCVAKPIVSEKLDQKNKDISETEKAVTSNEEIDKESDKSELKLLDEPKSDKIKLNSDKEMHDSYKKKLESTIMSCKAQLGMEGTADMDGGAINEIDDDDEDDDVSNKSTDGDEDVDDINDVLDDEEEEEDSEEIDGAEDEDMEVVDEEKKTKSVELTTVSNDTNKNEDIENQSESVLAPADKNENQTSKSTEEKYEQNKIKKTDKDSNEQQCNKSDATLESEVDHISASKHSSVSPSPEQSKDSTPENIDNSTNIGEDMEVDETEHNSDNMEHNHETVNKDVDNSEMAPNAHEKNVKCSKESVNTSESPKLTDEKLHTFLGIKVGKKKDMEDQETKIDNDNNRSRENKIEQGSVENPEKKLNLRLSSTTGKLTETENMEEDSDADRLVIDLDGDSDINLTPPRFSMKGGSVKNSADFKKGVSPLVTSAKIGDLVENKSDKTNKSTNVHESVNASAIAKTGELVNSANDNKKIPESVTSVSDNAVDTNNGKVNKSSDDGSTITAADETPDTQNQDQSVPMETDNQSTVDNMSSVAAVADNTGTDSDVVDIPTSNKIAEKFSKKLLSTIQSTFDEMCAEVVREQTSDKNIDAMQKQLEQARWDYCTELTELRHNFQLTVNEMKACWQTEKEKLTKNLTSKHTEEMEKITKELKKKQWCAYCQKEAIFYCCWNTSYCDYPCQQNHWPQHMHSCLQTNKDKTGPSATSTTGPTRDIPASSATGSTPDEGQSSQSKASQMTTSIVTPPNKGETYKRLKDNLTAALHREEERRGESRIGNPVISPKYGSDTRSGMSPKYIPMSSPMHVIQNARPNTPASMATSMMFGNITSPNQMGHSPGMMHQVPRNMFVNQQISLQAQRANLNGQPRQANPRMVLTQPVLQQALYPVQLQPQPPHAGTILFQNAQQQGMMGYSMRPPF